MAIVQADYALDMRNEVLRTGTFTVATETTLTLSDGPYSDTYTGNFVYDEAGDIYGEIEGFASVSGNTTTVEATQVNRDAKPYFDLLFFGDSLASARYVLLGDDLIQGSAYNDFLLGYSGDDLLAGRGGNDMLYGDEDADRLLGGAGRDLLNGGTGSDTLEGGGGNDNYYVDTSRDRIVERKGEGADYVFAPENFALPANVEHLRLIGNVQVNGAGNALSNRIDGNSEANVLRGGGGSDALFGNGGADRLEGELGRDLLSGGAEGDVFLFRTTEAAGSLKDRDVVRDFQSGLDLVHLAAIDADVQAAGDQSFAWVGGAGFSQAAGELRQNNRIVEGDVDGDGLADFQIALIGPAVFAEADFLL